MSMNTTASDQFRSNLGEAFSVKQKLQELLNILVGTGDTLKRIASRITPIMQTIKSSGDPQTIAMFEGFYSRHKALAVKQARYSSYITSLLERLGLLKRDVSGTLEGYYVEGGLGLIPQLIVAGGLILGLGIIVANIRGYKLDVEKHKSEFDFYDQIYESFRQGKTTLQQSMNAIKGMATMKEQNYMPIILIGGAAALVYFIATRARP